MDSHTRPSSPTECLFKAEVTEVTPTEAVFRVEVSDAGNGTVIGSADYERVVVGSPYEIKLVK
jgi:acyl-coenzyme A thioesterase PaaI-like protein